ncbi:MAG: GTP-binding protein [Thermoplasmata archaeon]|nr:MAG: GTP-binding protein [Thermoplasmata archaeon]
MPEPGPVKLKICLVGEIAVGKTCLIKKYAFNQFSDNYICTIGTKVTKKKIKVENPKTDEPVDVHLLIWDIMGRKGLRHLLQQAYFFGAQGIIGVCDNTREDTLLGLDDWIEDIQNVAAEIPTVLLGNKCDLEDDQEIGIGELRSFASGYEKSAAYLSSAKTGFNVDRAFNIISKKILKDMYTL